MVELGRVCSSVSLKEIDEKTLASQLVEVVSKSS